MGSILYYQNCTDKEKAKYDKIQYNAARLVTSTLPYTRKEKLFVELGWETIEDRSYILGISLFHKTLKQATRPLARIMLPKFTNTKMYNTRSTKTLKPFPFKSVKYSNSFFPYFTKKYNNLPLKTLRNLLMISSWKSELKINLQDRDT